MRRTTDSHRKTFCLWVAVTAVAALVLAAPGAQATFPGNSGRIALARPDRFQNMELWSVSPKTGRARPLTRSPRSCQHRRDTWVDEQPSFSASGRWVVYNHYDDCSARVRDGIYMMRSDGSKRRLLVRPRGASELDWPALSADGRQLAWGVLTGSAENPDGTVYVAPLANPAKRIKLQDEGSTFNPAWSSKGGLVASALGDATLFDGAGRDIQALTSDENLDQFPDWSPDGRQVAFERVFGGENGWTVYVLGSDGAGPRRFTAAADAGSPVWSPGGGQIAFIRDGDNNGVGTLYVKGMGGAGKARLVLKKVSLNRLSWQPLP